MRQVGVVTLGTIAVSISGGDISSAVTDGSSNFFANSSHFTPAIPLGDFVEVTGSFNSTFSYTITFSAPVTDPILHIASLASTMTFSGISLTKVSGETQFSVAGSTVTGQSPTTGGFDQNGTIVLNGTFSAVTFTVDALALFRNDRDGVALQVGADLPEPALSTLAGAGLVAAHGFRCVRQAERDSALSLVAVHGLAGEGNRFGQAAIADCSAWRGSSCSIDACAATPRWRVVGCR